MANIKKAPLIGSTYSGDTLLDIHGYDGYFEEIYISKTDINVTEMVYSLLNKNVYEFEDHAASQF